MVEIAGGGAKFLKRFYQDVAVEPLSDGAFGLLLDGRPAKTPKRLRLALPNRALADAVAAEWAGAPTTLTADALPLTRLAATALDLGPEQGEAWRQDILRYAGSDLLCYRAVGAEALVRRQTIAWDPYIDWARTEFDAAFQTTSGVVAIDQPRAALHAIEKAVRPFNAFRLVAVKSAAEITGSTILALALERRAFPAEGIYSASRIDADYQADIWGRDDEAERAAARLRRDFEAADRFIGLLALQ